MINRDEASIAYNAYSLLKTGHDERGQVWPLQIQSFGDWKLPGYIYSLIPFIKIFGLQDWVVKLPSLLAGMAIVILLPALVRLWTKDKRLSILVALLAAVNPWLWHFSRIAYEVNLALAFYLVATVSFYYFLNNWRQLSRFKQFLALFFAINFWSATVFTYHAFQLFTPLTVAFIFWQERQKLSKFYLKNRTLSLINIFNLLIWVVLFIFSGAIGANQIKGGGLNILDRGMWHSTMIDERNFLTYPESWLARLSINYYTLIVGQLGQNLADLFNFNFFFIHGGNHGIHDVLAVPNLLMVMAPLIIFGLILFFKEKKPWQKFLLWSVVAASLPALLTIQANHSTRTFALIIPLLILAAYAWRHLLAKKWWSIIIIVCLVWQLFTVSVNYFLIAPKKTINNYAWQMPELVKEVWQRKADYDLVLIDEVESTLYIYFLYYLSYDSSLLLSNLIYYPINAEGFQYAKCLENICFVDERAVADELIEQHQGKILHIFRTDHDLPNLNQDFTSKTLQKIFNPYNGDFYKLAELER